MKKFLITIFLIISLFGSNSLVYSAINQQNAEITKIENNIYGFDYSKNKLEDRVARLEKSIYGKNFTGTTEQRLKKIIGDISAEQMGNEIIPTEDTFKYVDDTVADSTVDYPIVDEIEQKLFNTTYKNRDFHTRIVMIERKLFGKIYDVEDYSTRMDRIKSEVMPERLAHEKVYGYDDPSISSNDLSGINSSRYASKFYGQKNYTRPYANYGEYASNENPLTNGNLEDELAKLEYSTFGTEFSNDDAKTRIKRLNSANKAQKNRSRYDNQRFQRHMSTAMEIGAMLLMILAMVL